MPALRAAINTQDEILPSKWEKDNEHYKAYIIADPEIETKKEAVSFFPTPFSTAYLLLHMQIVSTPPFSYYTSVCTFFNRQRDSHPKYPRTLMILLSTCSVLV